MPPGTTVDEWGRIGRLSQQVSAVGQQVSVAEPIKKKSADPWQGVQVNAIFFDIGGDPRTTLERFRYWEQYCRGHGGEAALLPVKSGNGAPLPGWEDALKLRLKRLAVPRWLAESTSGGPPGAK